MFPWLAGTFANRLGVGVVPPYAIAVTGLILVLWLLFQRHATYAKPRAASS